jgi:hypothetical protein
MGCVRLVAAAALLILGLTVFGAGVAGWGQSREMFPIGAWLTMVGGLIIAAIGYSLSPAAQRDEE